MLTHADIRKVIEPMFVASGAVGLAAAVVDAAGNTSEVFLGRLSEDGRAPDRDSIFGLASVTKSFTCLALTQMAEHGLIDLDAPVSRYIPELKNENHAPVTVAHLMSHDGGFFPQKRILVREVAAELGLDPDGELCDNEALAKRGAELVCARMDAQTAFNGEPGEYCSYFNDGFGLLSEIVRRQGGEKSFNLYLKKHILEPLGMHRSGCEFILPLKDDNAQTQYLLEGGKPKAVYDFYDNAFVLNGGGAMKASLADLEKYVRMYLRMGEGEKGRIVSRRGVLEMMKPRMDAGLHSWYARGLTVHPVGRLVCTGHGGSLTGVSSQMLWSPEMELGIIILCNTSGINVAGMADKLMEAACGCEAPALPEVRPFTEAEMLAPCGRYISGEGSVTDIFVRDGVLFAKTSALTREVPLKNITPDHLRAELPLSRIDIALMKNDDGSVWAIRTGLRIIPKI